MARLEQEVGKLLRQHIFQGNRPQNKRQAAGAALKWLKEYLKHRKGQ
jgi:hypothetical protein